MQRFLIVALLSIRLVADAAETSDWRRIPAIPLYAPLDARPIGDYIHVKGAALKMGQTNWMSVPENCAYSGRYGICRAPGEDTLRKNWYIVDLDSGARMHPIIGFINALENAAFALNGTIDVDRILAYISNPRRVVTEKGVGILAVALKDLGLTFFSTHDSLQSDGSTSKAWRFSGYAFCPRGCQSPPYPPPGPNGVREMGTIGEVIWLRDTSPERLGGVYWISLDYGRTWSRAPISPYNQDPVLTGPGTRFVEPCPEFENERLNDRICTSADGGATWDSSHSSPPGLYHLRYVGKRIVGYDPYSSDGIRILGSSDNGANWQVLRSEITMFHGFTDEENITHSGGLVSSSGSSSVRYIESPESPWITSAPLRLHEAPLKIRVTSDAVYLAQTCLGYRGLTLFRYRGDAWAVVREDIEDFEIVSGQVVVMSNRHIFRDRDPDHPHDATGYQTQVVTLTREISPGSWGTLLTHAFPEDPCAAGYKGQGIECPDLQAILESDGGTGLQIIRQGQWEQRYSGIHSTDNGATWIAGEAPFAPMPPIDPEVVRIDSSYDLLVKGAVDLPLAAHPRTKPGFALRDKGLVLDLDGPGLVRIEVLSPSGRILQVLPDREFPVGRHTIALPTGKGLRLVRVRIGQETTTLRWISPLAR